MLHVVLSIVAESFDVFNVVCYRIQNDLSGVVEEDAAASVRKEIS